MSATTISAYCNKIVDLQDRYNRRINTWLNHLVVIFAFFLPISNSGRISTAFLIYVLFMVRGKYAFYIRHALKDKLVQAFALYFLIHVIWLLGADNFLEAKRVMGEAKYLLYPLLFATIVDRKFVPYIFAAFFTGMLCSEFWSYGIFFEILPSHVHDGNQGTPSDPTPVFHHSHYGFMLAVTLTLVLQRLYYSEDKPYLRGVLIFFFITASINLFITAGRTGYILYLVLIFTLFLGIYRKNIFKAIALTVSLCAVAFYLAYNFSATFHDRTLQTVSSVRAIIFEENFNSSLGYRLAVVISGRGVVEENWLFGVGTGDHLDKVREETGKTYPQYAHMANSMQHLHNEYFDAMVKFGVLGLVIFIFLTYRMLFYEQSDIQSKNLLTILAVGVLFFSTVEVFVHGLGGMLVVVTLVSLSLNNYVVKNAFPARIGPYVLLKYASAVVFIELVSWVT